MTTGSFARGDAYDGDSTYRYWSGGDGKYENYRGYQRNKWNNYLLETWRTRAKRSKQGYGLTSNLSLTFDSYFNLGAQLQSKLLSKVRQHDFNAGVFLGTVHETKELTIGTLGTLWRAYRAARHGDVKSVMRLLRIHSKPAKWPKEAASRWLELQYGWKPLVNDVYEAWKALDVQRTRKKYADRVVVSKKCRNLYDESAQGVSQRRRGGVVTIKKILYEMTDTSHDATLLGLTDPLSVAWELLPYSFVVDWFIPIGTYLENLSQIPALQGRFCTVKILHSSLTAIPVTSSYVGGTSNTERFWLSREISTGLAVERPSFKEWTKAWSPEHVWNAIALAANKFLH